MEEIQIVDTTLRDGNTSLWAHNMTTGMMHPVLSHLDQAGFDAMEFFVSGRFKKVVREQRDNPWDWVRYGQKEVKNTRLRSSGTLPMLATLLVTKHLDRPAQRLNLLDCGLRELVCLHY